MKNILKRFTLFFSRSPKNSLILVLMFGTFSIISAQTNWILHSSVPTNKCLRCVISTSNYFNHLGACFVSGDSGTIISSTNNNNWVNQQSGITNDLYAILSDATVAGPARNILAAGKNGTIVSEAIGGTWQSQISGTIITLRAISGGGPCWVVVGDSGLILTASSINSTWSKQVSGTKKNLRSVFFPSSEGSYGSFVAVGDSGTILTSPNGVVWNKQISGTTKNLNAVTVGDFCCSGTRMVAVGDSGIILTSADSVTWISQTSGTTNALWAICCAMDEINGHSILYATVGDRGTILTSRTEVGNTPLNPAVTWTSQVSGTTRNLYGVSAGYDSLVVVGDSGTILTSYFKPLATGIKQGKIISRQQWVSISNGKINYWLSEISRTSIILYDTKGRFVKTLINQMQQPGSYRVALPHDVPPGIYTAAFKAGNQEINKTIIVSK